MIYDEVAARVSYAHEALLQAALAAQEAGNVGLMRHARGLADQVGYLSKMVQDAEQNFAERDQQLKKSFKDEGLEDLGFSARLLTPQEIRRIRG